MNNIKNKLFHNKTKKLHKFILIADEIFVECMGAFWWNDSIYLK